MRTGVGVSTISPTFISGEGMWAETGLKVNPLAGEVTPGQVAEAVFEAITKNKAEIDVMHLPLRASLKLLGVTPGLFLAVARSSGANRNLDELSKRQQSKR